MDTNSSVFQKTKPIEWSPFSSEDEDEEAAAAQGSKSPNLSIHITSSDESMNATPAESKGPANVYCSNVGLESEHIEINANFDVFGVNRIRREVSPDIVFLGIVSHQPVTSSPPASANHLPTSSLHQGDHFNESRATGNRRGPVHKQYNRKEFRRVAKKNKSLHFQYHDSTNTKPYYVGQQLWTPKENNAIMEVVLELAKEVQYSIEDKFNSSHLIHQFLRSKKWDFEVPGVPSLVKRFNERISRSIFLKRGGESLKSRWKKLATYEQLGTKLKINFRTTGDEELFRSLLKTFATTSFNSRPGRTSLRRKSN